MHEMAHLLHSVHLGLHRVKVVYKGVAGLDGCLTSTLECNSTREARKKRKKKGKSRKKKMME
jgi:hypothetical protein